MSKGFVLLGDKTTHGGAGYFRILHHDCKWKARSAGGG